MNNFEIALNSLKDELFSLNEVKEYFRLKDEIENNAELKDLLLSIGKYQRLMATNIDNNEEYSFAKENYELAMKKYKNHPLIVNFENVKEEVYQIILQIKQIIEK